MARVTVTTKHGEVVEVFNEYDPTRPDEIESTLPEPGDDESTWSWFGKDDLKRAVEWARNAEKQARK